MPFDGIVTKAVIEELQTEIIPGRVSKIYQPTKTELLFTIRSKQKNFQLLFSIHPTYARFHLTSDKFENPKEPPMFCMVMRKYLSGAIIEKIEQKGIERIITITVQSRNEIGDITKLKLIFELMGRHSNFMLIDERGNIIDSMKHISPTVNRYRTILPGATYISPPEQEKLNPLTASSDHFIKKLDFNAGKMHLQIVHTLDGVSPFIAKEFVHQANLGSIDTYQTIYNKFQMDLINQNYVPTIYTNKREDFHVLPITFFEGKKMTFQSTNEMLDHYYSGRAERERVHQQAKDLYRFIKNEKDKNERKLKKHQQTMRSAQDAEKYQRLGELLTAHLHLVNKGDASVTVIDYYDPKQRKKEINLNVNKTPSENAQHYFKKYQKMKNSKKMIQHEIKRTKEEIAYLEQLLQQIDVAKTADIEEIRDELREEGYLKKQVHKKRNAKKKKPSIEQYEATDGTPILIGKNNRQNEYLTMKLAHANDIWLHTKDIPGSHVVIRSQNPSEETIIEAAQLAAFFSKAQNSSSVPVDYTKIRHVRKPNGAKPGFVTYDKQKTVYVTPEEEIINKLKK